MAHIGTAQAKKLLGLKTQSRVVQLILAGELKATKIGRTWVIDERDLAPVMDRPKGRPPGTTKKKRGKK